MCKGRETRERIAAFPDSLALKLEPGMGVKALTTAVDSDLELTFETPSRQKALEDH